MSLEIQNGIVLATVVAAMVYVAIQAKEILFPKKQSACGTSCGGCAKENSLGTPKPFVASEQLGNYPATKAAE